MIDVSDLPAYEDTPQVDMSDLPSYEPQGVDLSDIPAYEEPSNDVDLGGLPTHEGEGVDLSDLPALGEQEKYEPGLPDKDVLGDNMLAKRQTGAGSMTQLGGSGVGSLMGQSLEDEHPKDIKSRWHPSNFEYRPLYTEDDLKAFEKWKGEHPNLYGLYGVAELFFGWGPAKNFFPEIQKERTKEREKLPKEEQTGEAIKQMFWDSGEQVFFQGIGKLLGPVLTGTKSWIINKVGKDGVLGKSRKLPFIKSKTEKAKQSGLQVMDLVRGRHADIGTASLDSEIFIRQFEQQFTKKELEAIPFLIEGIEDPAVLNRIGKGYLKKIIDNPSDELKTASKKISKYFDEGYEFLGKELDDASYIKDYVSHLWDLPGGFKGEAGNGFVTRNPFMKKRSIASLEQGIESGLVPKTVHIGEILRTYDKYKIRTVFNKQFVKDLGNAKAIDGSPLLLRTDKAPANWVTIDHPAMNRAMMTGSVKKNIQKTDTFTTITETIEKIKTIKKSSGAVPTKEINGRIKKLEEVIVDSLEHRGMSNGEANAYLTRMKSAYTGVEMAEGATTSVSERVGSKTTDRIFREIKSNHPVDIPVLAKVPVKVDPDIARAVKIIFDDPFHAKSLQAYETLQSFVKKSMLSISFFHHWALTEAAFASGIGGKAVSLWNPVKMVKSIAKKDWEIFKNVPLAKDAIRHNVEFGALEDVHRDIVSRSLKWAERRLRKVPALKQGAAGLRKANEIWDEVLWDYYHNTLKLWAYEAQTTKALDSATKNLDRALFNKEITEIKRGIGQLVNDTFGGQNWDLHEILGNPKMRQAMHWLLLSPDWTISTLNQAGSPLTKSIAAMMGKDAAKILANKSVAKRATSFWLKAAFYWNLGAQSTNFYQTKKAYGEGRFTWENPPGHEMNIMFGHNEDGTERYLRTGKQFRELIEYALDPIQKIGGKVAPIAQEVGRQIFDSNPGGFPTEWVDKNFWDMEAFKERGLSIAMMPIPFSMRPYVEDRPKNFMFMFPSSKGMTNYHSVELFKKALKSGDIDKVRRIYFHTLENNLDAASLFKSAKSFVKSELSSVSLEDKDIAKGIANELRGMDLIAMKDTLEVYQKRNILTTDIVTHLAKLLKTQKRVDAQRILFGITVKEN